MSYRYRSNDGLLSTNDPVAVQSWNSIGAQMRDEQREATRRLREIGVKAEHPDDGWVNRELNRVHFSYPQFNDGVKVGDLIALGWPWRGYRLVKVTRIERSGGPLIPMTYYYFKPYNDDFMRPKPVKKQRRLHRFLPRFK